MPKGVYDRPLVYKGKYKVGSIHDTPQGPIKVLEVDLTTLGRGGQTRGVIRFLNTGTVRNVQFNNIRSGKVKDYNLPSVCGVGYIGSELRIPQRGNSEIRRAYDLWANMLKRVTSEPGYEDVKVHPNWLNFTRFLNTLPLVPGYDDWVAGEDVHLDKDLRVPGSRVYGLDTCWFIPATQNLSK